MRFRRHFFRYPLLLATILMLVVPVRTLGEADQTKELGNLGYRTTILQQQIDANDAKIKELATQERDLKSKLAQITIEIDQANKQIEMTTLKIDELDASMQKAQAELTQHKELLRENLRTLYKYGGASDVELLLSNSTFSGYVNDQMYLQKIKDGITVSATAVARTKLDILLQRQSEKALYIQQDAQRMVLTTRKKDYEDLLTQTKGDQAKYQQLMKSLDREYDQAEANLLAFLNGKTFTSIGHVKAGEQVGLVGSTGISTGPHTHFTVFMNGKYVNPVESPGKLVNNFVWPLPNSTWDDISQPFGCTSFELEPVNASCPGGHFHNGLDITGWYGDPVVAAAEGDVIFHGYKSGWGNVAIINHGNGIFTYYPHLLQ